MDGDGYWKREYKCAGTLKMDGETKKPRHLLKYFVLGADRGSHQPVFIVGDTIILGECLLPYYVQNVEPDAIFLQTAIEVPTVFL